VPLEECQSYRGFPQQVLYWRDMTANPHSLGRNEIAGDIWTCFTQRNKWVTVISVPGKENVDAHKKSRTFNDNTEWALRKTIFHDIVELYGEPSIDLFASTIN